MFKRGDVVKVWSLQSFHSGGFINGKVGVVTQDQSGESVLVAVERNFSGVYKIDPSYEVYSKQLELVHKAENKNIAGMFGDLINNLKRLK